MTEQAKQSILNLLHGSSFTYEYENGWGYSVYRLHHLYILFENTVDESPQYHGLYRKDFIIQAVENL